MAMQERSSALTSPGYLTPFTIVTTLFFIFIAWYSLWGIEIGPHGEDGVEGVLAKSRKHKAQRPNQVALVIIFVAVVLVLLFLRLIVFVHGGRGHHWR